MNNKHDYDLLKEGIKILREGRDFVNIKIAEEKKYSHSNEIFDAKLDILYAQQKQKLYVICKKYFDFSYTKNLSILYLEKDKIKKNILIISENIPLNITEILKENNINYIDITGNIYLNIPPIYIFINDKRKSKKITRKLPSVFYTTGLKLIFSFLNIPESVNFPFRKLSQNLNISIASISNIMQNLITMGYIIDYDSTRKMLIKQDDLYRKWVDAYFDKLRPKLIRGKYSIIDHKNFHENLNQEEYDVFYSGEYGAERLDFDIKAGNFVFYSDEKLENLIRKYKLVKDENGNIEILKTFWNEKFFTENTSRNLFKQDFLSLNHNAPLLLIYADLLNSNNERALKISKELYEKHIETGFNRFPG
ncbi:MAG: type IV toxin-antitoxin system AbiEi family antitoxin [bacterium]|nr:type IV toxin-antitoxin system AbiEi family antitoxin [bacterium]